MKKLLSSLLLLALLVGCGSKETVEVNYVHSNHKEIAEEVLGKALKGNETQEIFDSTNALEVYYEIVDENNVEFILLNNMDYYFTGEVEFEACPFKLSVTGLAPYGYASQTIECGEFAENSEFMFTGNLYPRNEENAYNVAYESYYYEEDDTLFDYVLDLEEITTDDLKELVRFLYTESILSNYEGELWVRVYPKAAYDKAYETDTEESWNDLDTNHLAGNVWIDPANDIAEIYDAKSDELIERINFAK